MCGQGDHPPYDRERPRCGFGDGCRRYATAAFVDRDGLVVYRCPVHDNPRARVAGAVLGYDRRVSL